MLFYVIIIVLYCIYLASACLLNETIRINSLDAKISEIWIQLKAQNRPARIGARFPREFACYYQTRYFIIAKTYQREREGEGQREKFQW